MNKLLLLTTTCVLVFLNFSCGEPKTSHALNKTQKTVIATQPTVTQQNQPAQVPIPTTQEINAVINKTKPTMDSWIAAAQIVTNETANKNAQFAMTVLRNNCYARIILYQGLPTTQIVTEPKARDSFGVCFILINEADRKAMPALQEKHEDNPFAASYVSKTIAINTLPDTNVANPYLQGLILMHEMVHWKQDVIDESVQPSSEREVEAYEFEFELLDGMNLPGYQEFLNTEMSKTLDLNQNPYLDDSRVNQIFGGTKTDTERKMLSTILFFRIVFKNFEKVAQTAHARKIDFISRVYQKY